VTASLAPGALYHPARFQGVAHPDRYFEGWYLKCVDASGNHPLAVIPGVSYDTAGGSSHSFVQVIRPGGWTRYFRYPVEAFTHDPRRPFAIAVGENRFAWDGMHLQLDDGEHSLVGDIGFGPWSPWPVTLASPGIMGWYRFVPAMECYHGVISLDHALSGGVVVDGERLDFDGGRGYAEKDWGSGFPSSWVWTQSNHFAEPGVDEQVGPWRTGVCLTASVARIPWMGGAFTGFIAGLLVGGELYRFATYTGAKLTAFESGAGSASFTIANPRRELEVACYGATTAPLVAPSFGAMTARADEALGASVRVTLRERRGGGAPVLFEGIGGHAGVEVMNDADELQAG
jgi:hypothetical protein